jgi:putative flavoprotein involved in K+ transport
VVVQAGLAISYYMTQEGREHVALERAPAVANAWRNQRWNSFTLVTSNFQVLMPGAESSGNDPYGFMSLAEVVEYFDNYIERFRLPVLCGVEVFSVEKVGDRYVVRTSEKNYEAKNVVIATGLYQSPKIPPFSAGIGRKVYLSIGSAGRVPRRYRGKDISDWFTRIGIFDTKVEELKPFGSGIVGPPIDE